MSEFGHLSDEQMVRTLDDELATGEERQIEAHLEQCLECKGRYQEFGRLSSDLETLVGAVPVDAPQGEREALVNWLEKREREARQRAPVKHLVGWRVGAGMALTAALMVGIFYIPRMQREAEPVNLGKLSQPIQTFEVANESFVALPYGNSDVPLSTPEIVRMRVPVWSLAEAGLAYTSGGSGSGLDEPTVLADVLLGAGGEPLGVHVLSMD